MSGFILHLYIGTNILYEGRNVFTVQSSCYITIFIYYDFYAITAAIYTQVQ